MKDEVAKRLVEEDVIPPEAERFESIRRAKETEWKAKGYPEKMIERAFTWAEEWTMGTASRVTTDPRLQEEIKTSLYPQALELAETYMKKLWKAIM